MKFMENGNFTYILYFKKSLIKIQINEKKFIYFRK